MRYTIYLLFAVAAFSCAPSQEPEVAEAAAPALPNIIFIMADDLGYGDLGSYGQRQIQTPHLDQMAAEGMRFTQVYTGSPVCAPSRSVLMTGQHTGHTKVRGNFSAIEVPGLPEPRRIPLAPEDTIVAELLQQAGYITGMFGKWGLGEATTTGEPNAKGFDEWFGFNNQRRAHSHYPDYVWHNRDTFHIPANQQQQRGQHVHELFTQFAFDFLKEYRDTTFFMYLPYTVPHSEFAATDTFLAMYESQPWSDQEKKYAAMVSMLDTDVGRILDSLRAYGIDSTTMVFFCSDNGAANRYEGTFDSSGELRGRKRDMYEGGLRTPMIARMPSQVPAGQVSEVPWYFADVLPTLAALAKTNPHKHIDGQNVLPILLAESDTLPERYLYWEFHEREFDQAVRWQQWKGVRQGADTPLELYNLTDDLSESNDVSTQHPQIVQQLTTYLDSARTVSRYWPINE